MNNTIKKTLNLRKFYLKFIFITTKELSLMSFMLALFLIMTFFSSHFLVGLARISFSYIFYILYGIYFKWFKGASLAILSDTFNQLITGGLGFWMIQYAIVAPLISIISYLAYSIFNKKNNFIFAIAEITFINVVFLIIFIFIGFEILNNKKIWVSDLGFFSLPTILGLSIFLFVFIDSFLFYSLYKYWKNKKDEYLNYIFIFSLVSFIVILMRWLWGPYAFYEFYIEFLSKPNSILQPLNEIYFNTMIPIILKSTFTIPFFSFIILPLIHIKNKMNNAYQNNYLSE